MLLIKKTSPVVDRSSMMRIRYSGGTMSMSSFQDERGGDWAGAVSQSFRPSLALKGSPRRARPNCGKVEKGLMKGQC